MGLFRHTRSTSNSQSAEEPSDKLFPKEGIKCKSSLDKKRWSVCMMRCMKIIMIHMMIIT